MDTLTFLKYFEKGGKYCCIYINKKCCIAINEKVKVNVLPFTRIIFSQKGNNINSTI